MFVFAMTHSRGEQEMSYYFAKQTRYGFEQAIARVTEALKQEGFGILTEIDVQETLKKKLNVDFRRYKILGACNPLFAHQALQADEYIGTMLPCNVIVQEKDGGVEVAAVDPVASMSAVRNERLSRTADEVRRKLEQAIQNV